MKTIVVSNGDIQLNSGKIQFATGTNKLVQDITRWLQEPLGTGYTTPGFGSTLYSMVGQALGSGSTAAVQTEILRVLQLYQGQQVASLRSSQSSAQLANWNPQEVIQSIVSVEVQQQLSSIYAFVTLTTLNNSTLSLNINMNNNGVTVSNG